jgi:cell division protein FtsX
VHDLDTRLERLAAEATRDAVAPEAAAIARRGRRRRRRQLAGTALVVVAVAAAGLVVPARLAGRSAADRPLPASAPATDVTGAASIGGYWFGKADASVFLEQGVTPAQRAAVRRRIDASGVADQVWFESKADAYAHFMEQFRAKPEMVRNTDPSVMPESFRVRLAAPEDYKRLQRSLCVRPPIKPLGVAPCMDGVDAVVETRALLEPMLVAKPWLATSDASVFLPPGTTDIQRKAVRTRLEAVDGVVKVTYESPQAAFRRLPEKVRMVAKDSASPISMRASFRVALDQPTRVAEFHLALCGSRKTGECAGGLVVFEHPRKR